jgi:hypothetical protein
MRLPRAEAAPWAYGHYERKALRPAAKGLQPGPADPNNVSQRVPGLQGLHAREARDVSTQIWVEKNQHCIDRSWLQSGQHPGLIDLASELLKLTGGWRQRPT